MIVEHTQQTCVCFLQKENLVLFGYAGERIYIFRKSKCRLITERNMKESAERAIEENIVSLEQIRKLASRLPGVQLRPCWLHAHRSGHVGGLRHSQWVQTIRSGGGASVTPVGGVR